MYEAAGEMTNLAGDLKWHVKWYANWACFLVGKRWGDEIWIGRRMRP
jgi:hypothetical protein